MSMQESGEMYLETILILSREKGNVRSIDIADYMSYSKPSVSRAVGLLKSDGYILVDGDGYITLTETGYATASKIYERHTLLSSYLIRLGVDPKIAAEDACRMEHVISDASFEAIKRHEAAPNGTVYMVSNRGVPYRWKDDYLHTTPEEMADRLRSIIPENDTVMNTIFCILGQGLDLPSWCFRQALLLLNAENANANIWGMGKDRLVSHTLKATMPPAKKD